MTRHIAQIEVDQAMPYTLGLTSKFISGLLVLTPIVLLSACSGPADKKLAAETEMEQVVADQQRAHPVTIG